MLQHLSIQNYILIQNIHVNLSGHFNVFTGETGAGKSMLVDALNFVSGQRSNSSVVGKDGDRAYVEAVFAFQANHPIFTTLETMGLGELDDTIVSITREMTRDGRSTSRINHHIVNQSTVRKLLENVLDIHSQHETQYLLDANHHIDLLDAYAKTHDILADYQSAYDAWRACQKDLNALENSDLNPEDIKNMKETLKELTAFKASEEDYEQLQASISTMSQFEDFQKIYKNIETILDHPNALNSFYEGFNLFDSLNNDSLTQQYKDAYYQLEDVRDTVAQLRRDLSFDPYEFDHMQQRIYQYQQYLKQYGTIQMLLAAIETMQQQIQDAEHYDDRLVDAQNVVSKAFDTVMVKGKALRELRMKAALKLNKAVIVELRDLLLDNAQFKVAFKDQKPQINGIDAVTFTINMNKGESLSPLNAVASGGELSRLMLGLKVIFSQIHGTTTLVFDEIDTGVSGRVGVQIGAKMRKLAQNTQVLTISHLSSVAAAADDHYAISKADDSSQTVTSIEKVEQQQRVEHLALIMSGNLSEASLNAARELLKDGQAH